MKLKLTPQQAQQAVREYLADPGDGAAESVRIADHIPIRISAARGGGLMVLTGEDATKGQKTPVPLTQEEKQFLRGGSTVRAPDLTPPVVPPAEKPAIYDWEGEGPPKPDAK
jgi:hypothetical protein